MKRWSPLAAAALLLYVSAVSLYPQKSPANQQSLAPYFHELRRLRFNEVYRDLGKLENFPKVQKRHVTFGRAVAALNKQPRSEHTVTEADRLFERVRAVDPDDNLGVASAYYLARIVQIHSFQPDEEAAAKLFRELSLKYPQHYFGQLAFLNYATITLYTQPDLAAIGEALYRIEEEGRFLSIPDISRNYFRLMGETHVYYGVSKRKGEDFFVAAMEVGFVRPALRAKMLLRLAELARSRGDFPVAKQYYEQILVEFTRSRYLYITQKRLESLLMQIAEVRD